MLIKQGTSIWSLIGKARATSDPKAVVSADTSASASPRARASASSSTATAAASTTTSTAASTTASAGTGTANTASTSAEEVRQLRPGGNRHAGASSVELAVECGVEEPKHSKERDQGACRPRRAIPPT